MNNSIILSHSHSIFAPCFETNEMSDPRVWAGHHFRFGQYHATFQLSLMIWVSQLGHFSGGNTTFSSQVRASVITLITSGITSQALTMNTLSPILTSFFVSSS
ncbi:MAG: hypothetical protein ACD_3C00204G0001 [uncultured bacterium (gcode 4)]|uniref:Uncharacterized protein n=1 Tax=uncultured bacterium (gcode 4) TaxID=1234023 RepID=K2FWY7_9BACT|nr:MAG: hypothetical protein ACD_3C00204G0001 [uncultured bacterium (gcode 4)]